MDAKNRLKRNKIKVNGSNWVDETKAITTN